VSSAIELRHLRYFLAVAETSNFTRAAERLKVSQPSISQQIKDLEQALGATLFDRLGKTVRLTQAGAAFRANAEVVLRKVDEACAAALQVEGMASGHLHIGVVPAVCVSWIPEALERFALAHPGVTVSVHERPSNEVETEVEAGRLDLGVGVLTYTSRGVDYRRITSVDVAFLAPSRHPFARRESVRIEELDGARLILLPESFQLREMVEDSFQRAKCRPRVAFELNDIDALLGVVARTGIPTLLPSIVLEGRKPLGLRAVPLVGEALRLDLGLMWPVGAQHGHAAVALAETIVRVAEGADATAAGSV
jgi:LysR family cyn operon transcriptional activator